MAYGSVRTRYTKCYGFLIIVILVRIDGCIGKSILLSDSNNGILRSPDNSGDVQPPQVHPRNLNKYYRQAGDEESEEEAAAAPVAVATGNGTLGRNGTVPNIDAFTMFWTQVIPAVQGLLRQMSGSGNPLESAVRQFQDLTGGSSININFGVDFDDIVKMASKVLPPPLDTQFIGVYKLLQSHLPRTTTSRSQYINNLHPSRVPARPQLSPAFKPSPIPPSTTFRYYPEIEDINVGSFTQTSQSVPIPNAVEISSQKPNANIELEAIKQTQTPKPLDFGNFLELHQLLQNLGAFTPNPVTGNLETFTKQTHIQNIFNRFTQQEIETTLASETTTTPLQTSPPTTEKQTVSTRRYRIRSTTPRNFFIEEDEEEPEIKIPTEQVKIQFTVPQTLQQQTKSTPRYDPEEDEIKISPSKLQSILSKYQYNRQKATTTTTIAPLLTCTIATDDLNNIMSFEEHQSTTKQEYVEANTEAHSPFNEFPEENNWYVTAPKIRSTGSPPPLNEHIDVNPISWNSEHLINSEPTSNMNPWKEEITTTTYRTTAFDPYQAKYQYNLPKRTIPSIIETSTPVDVDLENLLSSGSIVSESWRRRKPPRRTIPTKI